MAWEEHGSVDEDAASEEDVPAGCLVPSTETTGPVSEDTPPVTAYDVPFNPSQPRHRGRAHSCTGDSFQGHRIVGMSLHLCASLTSHHAGYL